MSKYLLIILIIFVAKFGLAQDTIVKNGFQVFYYPNGKIASKGTMRDGKPDGYWKTFNKYGILKSEGNRKNFLLDSTWKFYNEKGNISLIINYKNDKKNGYRINYLPESIIVDSFDNDLKNNWCKILFLDSNIQSKTFYNNGLEEGWAYKYDHDGRLISKIFYINGFIKKREYFNALDAKGLKNGIWKDFYANGVIKWSGNFRHGTKNGYFKYYNTTGNLDSIQKFRNGILEEEPEELSVFEIKTDYYSDGSIKTIGSYKDGKAEGIRREYSRDGKILDSYIMHIGVIVGHGIIDDSGKRQKTWKLFYNNGRIKAEGSYNNNIKVGKWKYYFDNGSLEQEGAYDKNGTYTGIWQWYYKNGKLRVKEEYFEGEREGEYIEYNEHNDIMLQGEYVNSLREGDWVITVNGYIEKGTYLSDVRDGEWKYYYTADTLYFEGRYIDGSEDGDFAWYYRNGKKMKTGKYMMSLREGEWKYYNEQGQLMLVVKYKDGIEKEYNSVRIEPELELKDMEE